MTIDLANKRESEVNSPAEFGINAAQSPTLEYNNQNSKEYKFPEPQNSKMDVAVSGGQLSSTHLISGKQSNLNLDAQNYLQMIV